MAKLSFQHHYSILQCHDPSEFILIYWFAAQETIRIINVETVVQLNIFVETVTFFNSLW